MIRKKILSIFFDISQNRAGGYTKIPYLIVIILLFQFGCTDSILDDSKQTTLEAYGELKRDTLYAVQDTFIVGGKVNTGLSTYLMLGSYRNYHSSFLIKFSKLPADTITVDTLRLMLRKSSTIGDSSKILSGVIYRVTQDWDESVNINSSWDMLSSIDYSPLTSTRFNVSGEDSAALVFDLPASLVDIWRDTTAGDQNFGLLFTFEGAESIVKFHSGESAADSTLPQLIYSYKEGTSDTVTYDTVYASQDASLIDFDGTLDASTIYVGAGYSIYSFIRFDFSDIPGDALISTANFFFTQMAENSLIDENLTQGAYLRDVTTEYQDLPVFQIDSTFNQDVDYNILLSEETENQLSLTKIRRGGAGSQFIQSIINGEITYGSFYLEHYAKTQGISLYAIERAENPDISIRPFMVLEYYLPPKPRI